MIDVYKFDLPVVDILDDVKQQLLTKNSLIVGAPPGAGKSTLLPLALLNEHWLEDKKIILLEPRRLAAISIANRMAELLDEKVGEQIGYRIRFDTRVSNKTKIEVVTEGILTKMLQSDNSLEDVALVIFDEFHERSIHADIAMALCRESQQILRPDLKMLVMSATLNIPKLSHLLNAEVIESKGRQYPVDIIYKGELEFSLLPEMVSQTVIEAADKHEGDILVFLPGQGEIKKCEQLLKYKLKDTRVHCLYGILDKGKQMVAIMPNKNGLRKVVLATSIAETSLTIEGVTVVVDSGFGRTQKFDPNSGLSRLETIKISIDSADQRAGRAGRLSAGTCYRLWSKADQSRMQEHRTPSILQADLAPLSLEIANWNVKNINDLMWLDELPIGNLVQANELLLQLDAINESGITPHGKNIHKIPAHPRIANMLLKAKEEDMLIQACDLAAVLEERDPLPRDSGIDINLRIEALRSFRTKEGKKGRLGQINKVSQSYLNHFNVKEDNGLVNEFDTGYLVSQAYPERIAHSRPGNNAQFQLANGRYATAGHKDDLAHETWLAVANMDARGGLGKIFMASPLNPKDLARMVKERDVVEWDFKNGKLKASTDLAIGNIILRSTPLTHIDYNKKVKAICQAIKKHGTSLLTFTDEVIQLQNRVHCLSVWNNSDEWPNFKTEFLLETCENWLPPYLNNVKSEDDLETLNLSEILTNSLSHELQKKLSKLAPKYIQLPNGKQAKLTYQANTEPPILAQRIQQLFGVIKTPKVNNNTVNVLIHLLSPGYKPAQITSDLENFWKNSYFDVRKDLRGRYPKHNWPEDPLEPNN